MKTHHTAAIFCLLLTACSGDKAPSSLLDTEPSLAALYDATLPMSIDHSPVLVSVGDEVVIIGVIGDELVAQWAGSQDWRSTVLAALRGEESNTSIAAAGAPDGTVYVALGQSSNVATMSLIHFRPEPGSVETHELAERFNGDRRDDLYIGLEGPPLDIAVTSNGAVDLVYRSAGNEASRARWVNEEWQVQVLYNSSEDELLPGETTSPQIGAGIEIVHDSADRLFVNLSRGLLVSQGGTADETGNTGWNAMRADSLTEVVQLDVQKSGHERMRSRRARIAVGKGDNVYVGPVYGSYASPNQEQILRYGVAEVSGQDESLPRLTTRDPRLTNFTGQIDVNECGEVRTLDSAAYANAPAGGDSSWLSLEEDRSAYSCPTFARSPFRSELLAEPGTLGEGRYGSHPRLMLCSKPGATTLCGPDVYYWSEDFDVSPVSRRVSSVPEDGAVGVDPTIQRLTLRFDQPVSRNLGELCVHDIHRLAGGVCASGSFPYVTNSTAEGGEELSLDLSGTAFALEPGRTYRLAFGEFVRNGDYWAVTDDEVSIITFTTEGP